MGLCGPQQPNGRWMAMVICTQNKKIWFYTEGLCKTTSHDKPVILTVISAIKVKKLNVKKYLSTTLIKADFKLDFYHLLYYVFPVIIYLKLKCEKLSKKSNYTSTLCIDFSSTKLTTVVLICASSYFYIWENIFFCEFLFENVRLT